VRQAAAEDYRFAAIVLGIAKSDQFRLQRLPETEAVTAGVEIGR